MVAGDDVGSESAAIGCSVRGQKNVDNDVPCQDDNEKRIFPGDKYVIAAADGLGSASLSHVGSDTATQAVTNYIEDAIAGRKHLDEETALSVLREAFVYAREQLHQKANSLGEPVSNLNTTLLVAVGGPAGVGGAAVGDGGIVGHRAGQSGLVIPREETEYENKTVPLQSENWEESYRSRWAADVDAAAVFSDGLDGVAWDGPASVSDELFGQVFGSLREYSNLNELEAFLEEFLDGESLRESSRDDKTLVVGALPASEWTDPAAVASAASPFVDPSKVATADTGSDSDGQNEFARLRQTEHRSSDKTAGQVAVDERLGESPNSRRRIAAVAGIGVLAVAVVLAAVFLFGPLSGGEEEPFVDLSSAELNGAEGLIIKGNATDGMNNSTVNISIVPAQQNSSIGSINKTLEVNESDTFRLSLSPENLTNATEHFTYYDDTEYDVVVETGDGQSNTTLERGELRLNLTDVNVTDDRISGTGTLTQGRKPIHETDPDIKVSYSGNKLEQTDVSYDKEEFNFSSDIEVDAGGTVNVTFAGETASYNVEALANFEVGIDSTNSPVTEGDNLTMTATIENTGDQQGNQTVELTVDALDSDSASVQLAGGESTQETFSVGTSAGENGSYTAEVSSDNDTASTDVTVQTPANFTVRNIQPSNETVSNGTNISISADIENVGGQQGTQNITLTVDGVNKTQSQTLNASENTTVTFTNVDKGALSPGDYAYKIMSVNTSVTGTLTVQAPTNSTNSPVTEGDDLGENATVENTGDQQGIQMVELNVSNNAGTLGNDPTQVTLAGGADTQETLSVETESGDADNYTARVTTKIDSATQNIRIKQSENRKQSLGFDDQDLSVSQAGAVLVENVDVSIGDDFLGPNGLTAHVLPESDASESYQDRDELSDETVANVIDNETAEVSSAGSDNSQDESPDNSLRTVQTVERTQPAFHRPRSSIEEGPLAQSTSVPFQSRGSDSGGVR